MTTPLAPGFAVPPAGPLSSASFVRPETTYWIGAAKDWGGDVAHPAPRRQLLVTVEGEYEVTAGNGAKRRFGPGAVLLTEDIWGEGHSTEITGTDDAILLCIGLPDET